MEIRRATIDDYPALMALEAEVQEVHVEGAPEIFSPGGVTSAESYATLFSTPNQSVMLGIDNREAVAYLHYELLEIPASEFTYAQRTLHIHALSVKATQRRKGYGEVMLAYALETAEKLQLSRVTLDVWSFNQGAYKFYERMGFEPTRIRMTHPLNRALK
ncbi:MAG: GNAT family N-acetyltransferase [Chloroflexota bacterium]